MAIEFLDLRVSEQSKDSSNTAIIPGPLAPPLMFGDIGLQTAEISPENNGAVRVQLWGFVNVQIAIATTITIEVFKNGEPTPIFSTSTLLAAGAIENIGFSTTDFPVPSDFESGQIQYTAEISTGLLNIATVVSARNFSGMAVAGAYTG